MRHSRKEKDITNEWDTPNWAPLESRLPLSDCPDWMWMNRTRHGDRVIEAYKHQNTRGYLHLDQFGGAWRFPTAYDGCTPFCDDAHKHVPNSSPAAEQISFTEAFAYAMGESPRELAQSNDPAERGIADARKFLGESLTKLRDVWEHSDPTQFQIDSVRTAERLIREARAVLAPAAADQS